MPSVEQNTWTYKVLGIDVAAAMRAAQAKSGDTSVQTKPGDAVQAKPGDAMLPDCKPVKGKVPGPAEHLLCSAHGHVVDIKTKKIIASSVEDYKSKKLGSPKPAAKPAAAAPASVASSGAQNAAPPPAAAPAAAPAQQPASGTTPPPAADPGKAAAETKKLLALMQLEVEDIQSIQEQAKDLTGGSRLNRAISWVSDKAGQIDDPGEELAQIAGTILVEHMSGMAAVAQQNFDVAHQHLDTMRALTKKANSLVMTYINGTEKGAGRVVTGLEAVSKAGDIATMGLNVVAPGAGKILGVAKTVSVAGSKMAFGEKVNWAEFTVDMAFDLYVGGEGSGISKTAEKVAGPLAKKLAPKLAEAIAKKWGAEAAAKKLGAELTKEAIEKYITTEAEELIKDKTKEMVKPIAEAVAEKAKGSDVTHGQLADQITQSMVDPSGAFASRLSDKVMANFKP